VVRGNPDGSLKVTESRALEADDLVAVVMRVSLSWLVGFMGLFSMAKGARAGSAPPRPVTGTSDPRRTGHMRSRPGLARMRPWCWSVARTRKRVSTPLPSLLSSLMTARWSCRSAAPASAGTTRLPRAFFASLKGELIDLRPWPTRAAARRAIVEYIGWYNALSAKRATPVRPDCARHQ
jgi:Integrase core domain